MNYCVIFLQKEIDNANVLWYNNYVHISFIRVDIFLLINLIRETAEFACIFVCDFRTDAGIKRKIIFG